MVLRGTKTKPVNDPITVKNAIIELEKYLNKMDEMHHAVETEASHLIAQVLDNVKDDELKKTNDIQTIEISTEITKAIKVLLERLEYLENEEIKIQKKLELHQKQYIISLKQLICGGIAGMIARTFVAPIDRIKLLIQTSNTLNKSYNNIFPTLKYAIQEGGIISLWRGNFTNCIRVFPYAAIQFGSYERFKNLVCDYCDKNDIEYGFVHRLISGACAGATAATLTYPLDVIRVRQAVINECKGPMDAIKNIINEGGYSMFFKGWSPTVLSLAPFIAVNFGTFDYLKSTLVSPNEKPSNMKILGLGACAGIFAQSCCYPLDTIRRSMQMPGNNYSSVWNCMKSIYNKKGFMGFYKGVIPNAIKIVPNNGIRFLVYTNLTHYFGVPGKRKSKD